VICFEIDPTERTIRSVELPAIPEGYGDDPKFLNELGDVIYFQRDCKDGNGFVIDGVRAPLLGVCFVAGTNEDGDDVPPKAAYDSLVSGIDFGHAIHGMFRVERHVRAIQ